MELASPDLYALWRGGFLKNMIWVNGRWLGNQCCPPQHHFKCKLDLTSSMKPPLPYYSNQKQTLSLNSSELVTHTDISHLP